MNVKLDLNTKRIKNKVTNDKFGLFVSQDWKRYLDPYTPKNTGALMGEIGQTVDIMPFRLHYKEPYAERQYYGESFNFQHINPFSTHHWDEAAASAGKLNSLYRDINTALRMNRI